MEHNSSCGTANMSSMFTVSEAQSSGTVQPVSAYYAHSENRLACAYTEGRTLLPALSGCCDDEACGGFTLARKLELSDRIRRATGLPSRWQAQKATSGLQLPPLLRVLLYSTSTPYNVQPYDCYSRLKQGQLPLFPCCRAAGRFITIEPGLAHLIILESRLAVA